MRVLLCGGVGLTELIPMEETELEKKAKAFRAKMVEMIKPHISVILFAVISASILNWTYAKYGEPKLIIGCTVLLAVLLFRRGR